MEPLHCVSDGTLDETDEASKQGKELAEVLDVVVLNLNSWVTHHLDRVATGLTRISGVLLNFSAVNTDVLVEIVCVVEVNLLGGSPQDTLQKPVVIHGDGCLLESIGVAHAAACVHRLSRARPEAFKVLLVHVVLIVRTMVAFHVKELVLHDDFHFKVLQIILYLLLGCTLALVRHEIVLLCDLITSVDCNENSGANMVEF